MVARLATVAAIAIGMVSPGIATAAPSIDSTGIQSVQHNGSYRPTRPSIREVGPQCRWQRLTTCSTYRGKTVCKPVWKRVCPDFNKS